MKCQNCNRELREDSKFCDNCGFAVKIEPQINQETASFDYYSLFSGILISVLFTAGFAIIAHFMGWPIFLGGLFLPLFFRKKRKES